MTSQRHMTAEGLAFFGKHLRADFGRPALVGQMSRVMNASVTTSAGAARLGLVHTAVMCALISGCSGLLRTGPRAADIISKSGGWA